MGRIIIHALTSLMDWQQKKVSQRKAELSLVRSRTKGSMIIWHPLSVISEGDMNFRDLTDTLVKVLVNYGHNVILVLSYSLY